ncbi:charged multivesicular body protein 2a [Naegleria gruberi]|uniref:Charged multivesicular body protein 2a n=1 Tax=Naegleria gruberi TaxID=5762 RepID=D2VE28_NAEGR|nr:charged multivesicular body protein 2a [Naegleria gruberi]EFC45006.1 charged multivesicular body protein 2a [Naegleria gruberi]|eukprot:XP_002677750.1 charged multivesicular body protein 2a [Naegleria gruberi strain NEG-M]
MLEAIFGKKKTPKELLREYKRNIERTMRQMERERLKLQNQEKKLINDMRRLARQNQMETVKIMAKDLVRTRNHITKMHKMNAQLQAISLKLTTLNSTNEMTQAMKGMTRTMTLMNKRLNLPEMQKIMQEFMKQNEMMDMKEEMMGDMMDDVMEDDEVEEDELVNQVLDEIGLDMSGKLGKTPNNKILNEETEQQDNTDDLQERLENLRKN